MSPKIVSDDNDTESTDSDGSNEVAKEEALSARAKTGDAKNAAGRSLAERQSKAKVREKLYDDVGAARANAAPDAVYNKYRVDPITGKVTIVDDNGAALQNEYDAPDSTLKFGTIAPKDSPRQQITTNNVESGLVTPESGEAVRAAARSGEVEQLEVENAEAAGDAKRAAEAKVRRLKIVLLLVGGVLVTAAIIAGITVPVLQNQAAAVGPAVKDAIKEGLDPKKTQTLVVASEILATANDPLADVTKVKLTTPDTGNPLRKTKTGFGVFELLVDANKATTGQLRFTPEAGFMGGDVAVGVTIAGKNGVDSGPVAITLKFIKGAKGPQVKSAEQVKLNPSKDQPLDVSALILAMANDPTADKTSVKFANPDAGNPLRLTVPMAGLFELEADTAGKKTGKMTFRPLTHYLGGTAPEASVTIDNLSGEPSETATVKLGFDRRIQANDLYIQADLTQANVVTFNPITAKGVDMGPAAVKGSYAIDPRTVFLILPAPIEGAAPQTDKIKITGGKTAVAVGEGTWTVDSTNGDITFTREPLFRGDPTPLAWTVSDTTGIPSTLGTLTITSYLKTVVQTIRSLNTMSDAAFWKNYEDNLVNADFGTLDTTKDVVGILTLFRTVHTVIVSITRQSMTDAAQQAVLDARPAPTLLDAPFTSWAAAGLSRAELYKQGKTLTPTPNPQVDGFTLGARAMLLDNITRLLGRWQNMMDAMPPPGGGN